MSGGTALRVPQLANVAAVAVVLLLCGSGCAVDPSVAQKLLVERGFPKLVVVSTNGIDESTSRNDVVVRDGDDADTVFTLSYDGTLPSQAAIARALAAARADTAAGKALLARLRAAGIPDANVGTFAANDGSGNAPSVEIQVDEKLDDADRRGMMRALATSLDRWWSPRFGREVQLDVTFTDGNPAPAASRVLPHLDLAAPRADSALRQPYRILTALRRGLNADVLNRDLLYRPADAGTDCTHSGCVLDDDPTSSLAFASVRAWAARSPMVVRLGRPMRIEPDDGHSAYLAEERLSTASLERLRAYVGFCYRAPRAASCARYHDGAIAVTVHLDSHTANEERIIDARVDSDGNLPSPLEPRWK